MSEKEFGLRKKLRAFYGGLLSDYQPYETDEGWFCMLPTGDKTFLGETLFKAMSNLDYLLMEQENAKQD